MATIETVNGVTYVTGATSAETGFDYQKYGDFFCANGKAITISARTDGQAGCTVTWEDNGTTYSKDLGPAVTVCGGSWDGDVASSTITMTGGTVNGGVFGGGVLAGADVTGNVSITVTGGTLIDGIVGGGVCGAVGGNIVINVGNADGGPYIQDNVIGGGFMETADVAGTITINFTNGQLGTGSSSNTAIMTGGGVFGDVTGDIAVNISGGNVYAIAAGGSMISGNVGDVSVNVTGGTVTCVSGGSVDYIMSGEAGSVDNAVINISGGTVTNSVYGGSVRRGDIKESATVNITGGTIGTEGEKDVIIAGSQIGETTGVTTVNISSTSDINGTIKGADSFTVDGAAANLTTIYVNAEYSDVNFTTGKIAGVNVFANFEDAIAAAAANSSITRIEIETDITQSEVVNTEDYYYISQKLTIAAAAGKEVTVTLPVEPSLLVQGDGASVKIEDGVKIEGLGVVAAGFATSNEELIINGEVHALSLKVWTSNNGITVNETGKVVLGYGDGQLDLAYGNGSLTVNGTLTGIDDAAGPQFKAGYSGTRGNGNTMTLNNTYFEAGAWFNIAGKNGTFNVNNSVLKVSGGDGAGTLTISNSGNALNINSGRLEVNTLTIGDNNTVTVSGESTVVIGNLVGELLVNADASLSGGISNDAPYYKDIAVLRVAGSNADGTVAKLTIAQDAVMNNQGLYVRVGKVQDEVITAGAMDIQGAFYAYAFVVEKGSVLDVSGILTGNPANTKQMNIYNDAYIEGIDIKGTANINNGGKVVGAFTTIDVGGVLNIKDGGTLYTFGTADENFNVNTINGVVNVEGSYITNRGVNVNAGAEFNVTGGTFDYEMLAVNGKGKDTVYGQSVFTNNGSVTVAGGSFEAFTLQNNGTVTVSGTSTLDIAKVTGNAIQVLDGATITDSTIGGDVHVFGNSSLVGSNTVSGILGVGHNGDAGYATEQVVLNITGNFTAGNALITSSFDSRLNVGDAEGARTTGYFGQLGAFGDVAINNADITYHYMFVRNDFTVTNSTLAIGQGGVNTYFSGNAKVVIDNSTWSLAGYANIGSYGGYMYGNADVTLTNKSTMTATNMGIENSGNYAVKLTVEKGSSFTATQLTLTAGAEIFVDATSSITATTLTNAGVINFDAGSTITVGNMTNTGTINVTAGSTYKGGLLIDDADNTGSTYGTVNITVEGQSGFEAEVIDGDLYAVNKGAIYVNAAWAGTAERVEVGEGMYFGINAFATLEGIESALTKGPCTVYFDYAAADVAGLVVTVKGETTITNYTFGNTAYSVLNAQTREHDIELVWNEKTSQYEFSGAFNFTSGDFSFEEIKTIAKNPEEPEDVTGSGVMADGGEQVQVGGVSGDKSYTFTLDAISDFDYTISGIEGTGRLTLTNTTTGEVITRLFGNNGTYTLSELGAGTYTATFGGYGLINDEAEFNVEFEFAEIAVEVLNDERANATQIDAGSTTLIENEIGQETASDDIVDWFAITGMTPAADGTLVMDFAVDGDGRGSQIIVNVYKVAAGDTTLQTIGGFVVNDTAAPGEYDVTKTFYGVSATDTIYVQVFGYGQSDYSINLAQPTSL